MVKFFGLTIDGLLPSKAKAEVEGIATVKAEGAVSGVRATAELVSEKVSDLAVPVAKATLTPGFEVAPHDPVWGPYFVPSYRASSWLMRCAG